MKLNLKTKTVALLAALVLTTGIAHAQTAPLVYNQNTRILAIPEVAVGATIYRLELRYDFDGRLSIISATPILPTSFQVAASCGDVNFTTSKFNAITSGMTLEQVNQTIGCKNDSTLTVQRPDALSYAWVDALSYGAKFIVVKFNSSGTAVLSLSGAEKTFQGF